MRAPPRRRGALLRLVALPILAAGGAAWAVVAPAAAARRPATPSRAASRPCGVAVRYGPLPLWARAGFHPPDLPMPHVLGAKGQIAAILWARHDPLHAPPLQEPSNKILWVSKAPVPAGSNLRIRARRMVGSTPVGPVVRREVVGGPGPSEINLPLPGCWRLTLRWSGHLDHVDLRYVADP